MGISNKDIKLLWGRSGNRCAMCRIELTQDAKASTSSFTLGEQAHIVGEKEGAARGKSPLTSSERDSYHNRILLCPNDHTKIDGNEKDWPVERLHQYKSAHELWVTETLSETIDHVRLAESTVLASIVDKAVSQCQLENWLGWTSFALSPDPRWSKELLDSIYAFRQQVIAAIWPSQFDGLKNATITLSVLLDRAARNFMENSELRSDTFIPVKFYKIKDPNPNYDKDLERYRTWLQDCYSEIYLATKAANWFADEVRSCVNPMFFAEEGRFLIEEGPFPDFTWRTKLLEFSEEEKSLYPDRAFVEN